MQVNKILEECVQKLQKYLEVNINHPLLLMLIVDYNVVVINASKINLTGNKWDKKYISTLDILVVKN